jgi:hypothetical protein
MQLFEFPIMKVGNYGSSKGGMWDRQRLQRIAENYDPNYYKAPLVLGHPKHDSPAHGWVQAVEMRGNQLWAKVEKVSKELVEHVRDGRFGPVSAKILPKIGIYQNLRGLGEELRHIGFQGAVPPVVKGLGVATFAEGEFSELTGMEDCDITIVESDGQPATIENETDESEEIEMAEVSLDKESKGLLKGVVDGIAKLIGKEKTATELSELETVKKENETLKADALKAKEESDKTSKTAMEKMATEFAEKCLREKKIMPAQKPQYIEVAMTKTPEELETLFGELPALPGSMFKQESKSEGDPNAKATVEAMYNKMDKDGDYDSTRSFLMSELGMSKEDADLKIQQEHMIEFSEEDAKVILQ